MELDCRYSNPRPWFAVVCVKFAGNQFHDLAVVAPDEAVAGLAIQSLPYPIEASSNQLVDVGGNYRAVALCELDAGRPRQVEINLYPHRPQQQRWFFGKFPVAGLCYRLPPWFERFCALLDHPAVVDSFATLRRGLAEHIYF